MRKTIMALILVLPMVFVLVVFSSVRLVSLGVDIAVNGIKILSEDTDEGTLVIDMAKPEVYTVKAEVTPANATKKGYTLASGAPDIVEVDKDGKLIPKREGNAEIIATSNDKSFTDSMSVVVVSSKPYDFAFTLTDGSGDDLLTGTEDGYEATLPTGTYSYGMTIYPMGYSKFTLEQERGPYTEIERGQKTIFLPFSGETVFDVSVADGVNGTIRKKVTLHTERPKRTDEEGSKTETAMAVVNGKAVFEDPASDTGTVYESQGDGSVPLAYGTREARLYVECLGGMPTVESSNAKAEVKPSSASNQYFIDVTFADDVEESAELTIKVLGRRIPVAFSFSEFTFSVFADRSIIAGEDGVRQVTLLTDNAVTFYAVASVGAKDVEYRWDFSGPEEYIEINGNTATVQAPESDDFVLTVSARCGTAEPDPQRISISVIKKVSVVQIAKIVKPDLAENYTVAGMGYSNELKTIENSYPLEVYTYSPSLVAEPAGSEIVYTVSDESVAVIKTDEEGRSPVLIPKGTGKVTVKAAWAGNTAFGTNGDGVAATVTFNVVKEAVAVKNYPELVKATDDGLAIVLTDNIRLGTHADGSDYTDPELVDVLRAHRMKSTYNIEWYKNTKIAKEADAYISYILEFTGDVYGNGRSLDADNFTYAFDGTGNPRFDLYRGPLYFVNYSQTASVAGQDNCAFLIRTDGVRLYGVNLLGCSDDSLLNEKGEYDLTHLNLTGTTLEINASCEIVNCRIRNGRNVVRAYGGNRDGNKYFIDSLSENAAGVDKERITVKIEGCILAQGREFILKIGANRALRANTLQQEPALKDGSSKDGSSKDYEEKGKTNRYTGISYDKDSYFYTQYVMTDVTLKNSVLETSGLFTVGIESNFSGEYLYGKSTSPYGTVDWEKSGGTSFASVLRLEGDVRLYDWKDLALIDSSTLIESPVGALSEWLKLDIQGMLDFVVSKDPAAYGDLIETTSDGKKYVHGGIALYGGGRNYSGVIMNGLEPDLADFLYTNVNISVLADGKDSLEKQGTLLPKAAGTHDFNFYMYGKNSQNNFVKQRNDEQKGLKYKGVLPVSAF